MGSVSIYLPKKLIRTVACPIHAIFISSSFQLSIAGLAAGFIILSTEALVNPFLNKEGITSVPTAAIVVFFIKFLLFNIII